MSRRRRGRLWRRSMRWMAHQSTESSNIPDEFFEVLTDWNRELERIDSPALRTNKEAQP